LKKNIALFDFDGTLTTKDTLLEFIKFSRGTNRFWTGFLLNSPYLVAYKLKLISNQTAKEKVLRFFFNQMPLNEFEAHCQRFASQVIPQLIRPRALDEIKKLQENDTKVIIVSASPENWVHKWSDAMGIQTIATRLTVQQGKLTGKIEGHNCHGKEKVRRIQENFKLANYDEIYAYGDSSGDKPMLAIATYSFMKPFR